MAFRLRIDVLTVSVLMIAALTTAPAGPTLIAPAKAETATAKSCERIAGVWTWSANGDVTFNTDGTLVQGKLTGRWFCDSARGQIVIVWSHGVTDIVSVSDDGTRASGVNSAGSKVSGQRKASATTEIPCAPDTRAFIKGFFPGTRCAPDTRIFGLHLAPLSDDLRRKFQISDTVRSGLVVLDIGAKSTVINLRPGDVVVEFAHDRVSSVDDIIAKIERLRAQGRGATVMLVADAKGELRLVAANIPGVAPPSPPPSSSPSPQAAPLPAPPSAATAGEWTTGWNRMEVTTTLKPWANDPKRGVLGIRNANVDFLATLLAPSLKQGAVVVAVQKDGAVAGQMHAGDIITAVDGRTVRSAPHLASLLRRNPPGTRVKIEFWRRTGGYMELRSAISHGAQANNATANYLLGVLEASPETGKPNFRNAFSYYLRAATLGSVHGMGAVAQYYQQGQGTEKNPSEAARWFRQAVERGSTLAMFHLAHLIASGEIGAANPTETFQLMERAAKGGLALAHYYVASYYDAAYGTARNPEAGARHLIEAIRHGGTGILVRYSTEKTWKRSVAFYSALQRQLQGAKVYRGPIDGQSNPELLEAFVSLQLERRP